MREIDEMVLRFYVYLCHYFSSKFLVDSLKFRMNKLFVFQTDAFSRAKGDIVIIQDHRHDPWQASICSFLLIVTDLPVQQSADQCNTDFLL